jgi:hypothetical protein
MKRYKEMLIAEAGYHHDSRNMADTIDRTSSLCVLCAFAVK